MERNSKTLRASSNKGKGELTNLVAEPYRTVNGQYALETWSTPVREYQDINGMMIPTKGEAIWKLSSGDFSYFRGEIIDIEYNNPSIY